MRPFRFSSFVPLLALLGLALELPGTLARADGITSRSDVLPVSKIKAGMKGYGLTVFQGTKPERFDVEVIDVLQNFIPHQELILIKTRHPRLEVTKVVAGMSGSPIYIDGKMIGAYSYGWTFGSEPVAGVTPIRAMLDDMVRPLPKRVFGVPVIPGAAEETKGKHAQLEGGGRRFTGEPAAYALADHAKQLASTHVPLSGPNAAPLAPVATPLLMGGFTASSLDRARDFLSPLGMEPMQAGGGGVEDPDAPTRYEDGGAIGVELIRGDLSAMGLGTVTRVEGDKLVAFGHPMMQSGITALPTSIGKVLWFLASDMRSFKIGTSVRSVGALVNDRQASIVVSHSAKAPIIPVHMTFRGVEGAPFTDWHFEVAHERFMSPMFLAMALGSAVETVASERQDVSWNAKSTLVVKGVGELHFEDYGVAVGGTPGAQDFARSNLISAAGALLNNPWEDVQIESASMELELRFSREILQLRGAEILESEIDAGEPARIRLTLVPYSGPTQTRVVTVPIPANLAGQTVSIDIAPGYMVEREQPDPENVKELAKVLQDPVYPPKTVVFSFQTGQGGVAFRGRVAKNLPPGAMDSLLPSSGSLGPEAFRSELRTVATLPEFLVGRDRVSVKVRPVLR